MELRKVLLAIVAIIFIGCCSTQTTSLPELQDVVVKIEILKDGQAISSGSAVLVDCYQKQDRFELLLLTAKHVVPELSTEITAVIQFYTNSDVKTNQIQVDQKFDNPGLNDVTILIAHSDIFYYPAKLSSHTLRSGNKVLAAGFPLGIGLVTTEGVLNFAYHEGNTNGWVCSAPAFLGNSGGGVFEEGSNKLVGITIQIMVADIGHSQHLIYHLHIFVPVNYFASWLTEITDARK